MISMPRSSTTLILFTPLRPPSIQLLLANEGSAEGLLLSFADEDKGFCLTLPSAIMSPDEHSARLETLGRRLSGSCKGLLEIGSGGRVTLLHRTLRDFLVRPKN